MMMTTTMMIMMMTTTTTTKPKTTIMTIAISTMSVTQVMFPTGSEITFRVYGIACILVVAVYAGTNYFLQDRGHFSHGSAMAHELMEDSQTHLAPHGVPSGIGRDLSASRLAGEDLDTQQKGDVDVTVLVVLDCCCGGRSSVGD